TQVTENGGRGVTGTVEGHRVAVGALSYVRELEPGAGDALTAMQEEGAALRAFVSIDGRAAGTVTYADRIRPSARGVVARLRSMGFSHVLLLSGDSAPNVAAVAREVGIAETGADLLPE